ncbi:alpha/beta fold hydrolase [Erythrobacter sp. JK5]|uniref:alpha/beta fold hydrolase n=1 Tax=Erythrobacter sp. JK5 TaxID=2829500 RepID=UPI001BAE4718|nr:alpha/beta fold hydrolase [Erythrobacter sp. JK5]QUL38732.1 alpha/beta fold hydrolase [Erythrobacter sp. JK5]
MILAALALSACAIQPPDPLPLTRNCTDSEVALPQDEAHQLSFFHSTAIPDCGGPQFVMQLFRHTEPTFGTGTYQYLADEPGDPVLARHSETRWLAALQQAIDRPEAQGRLIVFIHGYATEFDEAHMDAAELRRLAGDDVPLVMLHWPSRGSASAYFSDRASIEWAQDEITRQIARFTRMSNDITLVSHSLGAQALTNAAIAIESDPLARPVAIRRIVLASPDLDRHQALRPGGIVDQVLKHDRRMVIYASARDNALRASRNVNGYSRLGSTSCKHDVVFARRALGDDGSCHLTAPRDGLAIVDTGPSDAKGLLRHNDFLKSCQVREDLRAFLRDEAAPAYRSAIFDEAGATGFVIDPSMDFDGAPCDPIM